MHIVAAFIETGTVRMYCVIKYISFAYVTLQASSMLGSIIGAPIAGYLVDRLGRKTALATNVIPYLIGYLITLMTSLVQHGVTFKVLLVSGRLIAGIGQGWTYVVVPVSISLYMLGSLYVTH